MRNLITIVILQFLLLSCNSKPTKVETKQIDSVFVDTISPTQHTKSFSLNDSISNYYEGIIGDYRVEYYIRNDSTSRFVPGHLQRYVYPSQEVDSTSLPYARKIHILVSKGEKSIRKEITRSELHSVAKVEDIEYFQIQTVTAKYSQRKNILFTISMSMDDTLYYYEFDYEYKDGEFTLIEYRGYDDEGVQTVRV